MGYTLTIGEVGVFYDQEDEYVRLNAKTFKLDNAPAFGEPTDYTNERWPSYSSWADFCRFVGLYDLFFNERNGIIRYHPGCVPLSARHKREIDVAYTKFKSTYPNAIAGYSPKINFEKKVFDDPGWPKVNGLLCRLEWLKFWVDWALENCKQPVFVNT